MRNIVKDLATDETSPYETVIDKLSLVIQPGEKVAIVGRTGR